MVNLNSTGAVVQYHNANDIMLNLIHQIEFECLIREHFRNKIDQNNVGILK